MTCIFSLYFETCGMLTEEIKVTFPQAFHTIFKSLLKREIRGHAFIPLLILTLQSRPYGNCDSNAYSRLISTEWRILSNYSTRQHEIDGYNVKFQHFLFAILTGTMMKFSIVIVLLLCVAGISALSCICDKDKCEHPFCKRGVTLVLDPCG